MKKLITLEDMQKVVQEAVENTEGKTQTALAKKLGVNPPEINVAIHRSASNRVASKFGYRPCWVKMYEKVGEG